MTTGITLAAAQHAHQNTTWITAVLCAVLAAVAAAIHTSRHLTSGVSWRGNAVFLVAEAALLIAVALASVGRLDIAAPILGGPGVSPASVTTDVPDVPDSGTHYIHPNDQWAEPTRTT